MKLDEFSEGISAFLYAERYVNAASRSYSVYASVNEVSQDYQPSGMNVGFDIPAVLARKTMVTLSIDSPSAEIEAWYLRGDDIVFPVHPETWSLSGVAKLEDLKKLPPVAGMYGSPTASTRTVLVQTPFVHFAKLHCPKKVSRFVRRFRAVSVRFSVAISRDLQNMEETMRKHNFGYLPEVLGASVGEGDEGWGFVVREMTPRPSIAGKFHYLPFFALFAEDAHAPEDLPLLVQLIERHHIDPSKFTLDHIIRPLIASWCLSYRERGVVFGAHGQNVLLEIDEAFMPTRIIHRDLDLQVDPAVRTTQGIASDFEKSRIGIEVHEPRERALSLKYDMFMGHHLFDYLAAVLQKHYGVDPNVLKTGAKEEFRTKFPDADSYFDDTTYYYAAEPSEFNEFPLVPFGKPTWR